MSDEDLERVQQEFARMRDKDRTSHRRRSCPRRARITGAATARLRTRRMDLGGASYNADLFDPTASVARPLARHHHPKNGGRMRLTLGLGSGLAMRPGGTKGAIWAIADRGPNLKIKTAIKRYGLEHLRPLAKVDGAKVMPRPDIGPMICELKISRSKVVLVRKIPLIHLAAKPYLGCRPPRLMTSNPHSISKARRLASTCPVPIRKASSLCLTERSGSARSMVHHCCTWVRVAKFCSAGCLKEWRRR